MTKVAFISDIHSNLEALNSVLVDIEKRKIKGTTFDVYGETQDIVEKCRRGYRSKWSHSFVDGKTHARQNDSQSRKCWENKEWQGRCNLSNIGHR